LARKKQPDRGNPSGSGSVSVSGSKGNWHGLRTREAGCLPRRHRIGRLGVSVLRGVGRTPKRERPTPAGIPGHSPEHCGRQRKGKGRRPTPVLRDCPGIRSGMRRGTGRLTGLRRDDSRGEREGQGPARPDRGAAHATRPAGVCRSRRNGRVPDEPNRPRYRYRPRPREKNMTANKAVEATGYRRLTADVERMEAEGQWRHAAIIENRRWSSCLIQIAIAIGIGIDSIPFHGAGFVPFPQHWRRLFDCARRRALSAPPPAAGSAAHRCAEQARRRKARAGARKTRVAQQSAFPRYYPACVPIRYLSLLVCLPPPVTNRMPGG
jgi:hypothetical protein